MKIGFMKMQSLGNDFVILVDHNMLSTDQIIKLCDRRIGVGCDQLIFVYHKKISIDGIDLAVEFFNQDGSDATMCGNGLRCVAGWFFENNVDKNFCNIAIRRSGAIINNIPCFKEEGGLVSLDIHGAKIIQAHGIELVDVGNLHHTVVSDRLFNGIPYPTDSNPHKDYNINYISVIDEKTISITTIERGVGETFSCGSGSCAAVFYATKKGLIRAQDFIRVVNRGCVISPNERLFVACNNGSSGAVIRMKGTYRFSFVGTSSVLF